VLPKIKTLRKSQNNKKIYTLPPFLNNQTIILGMLKITNMKDASILKYINDYFKDLEVLVMASKE
jgi:hypothetical protein